jgi:trehalose 6-phosphate phosphatase
VASQELVSRKTRLAFAPLAAHPLGSAIVTDFDGTLSPIVVDPAEARPLDGVPQVLAELATRCKVVAVISGRPVSFLQERLDPPGTPATATPGTPADREVLLVGLYGLEWRDEHGVITRDPASESWRSAVDDAVGRLRAASPPGVMVEEKGLAVTIHWRQAPEAEGWATDAAAAESDRSGLRSHPGRMSVELRPALDIDKGSVIRRLVGGCSAACYLGDDVGDLPAFAALADLSATEGMETVTAAVIDDESADEVVEAADVTLAGPRDALALLEWLNDQWAASS